MGVIKYQLNQLLIFSPSPLSPPARGGERTRGTASCGLLKFKISNHKSHHSNTPTLHYSISPVTFVSSLLKTEQKSLLSRQFDGKSGSPTYLTCNLDSTFVALNYPLDHRQTETKSLPFALGGKKWFKNAG